MTTLDTIPPEILARICSYIPAKFMLSNFIFVCKKFYNTFAHDDYWRSRLSKFDPSLAFPASAVSDASFRWARTCAIVESEQQRWTKPERHFRHFSLTDGHIATVDAVHLMQSGRICISGSHDRCVCIWDLSRLPEAASSSFNTKDCLVFTEQKGHTGWIWTIDSLDDSVFTGAWDQKIIHWQLTPTELRPVSAMKCTAAVLCVATEPDTIVASTFDRQIKLFDTRDPYDLMATLNYHTRPVLGLATDGQGRHIYSCSEDKTVVCFDRRAAAVLHTLQVPDYAVGLCYNEGQLWVGDMRGQLRLIDSDWTVLAQYDIGGNRRVTDVKHNTGCVIAASYDTRTRKDAGICVMTAGTRPRKMADLGSWNQESTKMDYRNGVLACGSVDCSVRVWVPVDQDGMTEASLQ